MAKEDVDKAVSGQGTETLPPAGHERREALKERMDNLQQEAEELAERMLIGKIDKRHMEIDRDIASRLGYLDVSRRRSDMHYCWENYVSRNGQAVHRKQQVGWEVLSGTGPDCPEAHEHVIRGEDGTRKVGDVLLMRIPRERALVLLARQIKQARERAGQDRDPQYLVELGRKYGVQVRTHLSEQEQRMLELRHDRAMAQIQASYQKLGQMLEGGRLIPGVQIPGG